MSQKRDFSYTQRLALWLMAGGKCQICGIELDETWEADHVHPYSKNGETDVINGQALCRECNRKKGNKDLETRHSVILREWQQEQHNRFVEASKKWYMLVATPGAGKTVAMLNNAYHMIKSKQADFLVVVTPSETLKSQWKDKAALFGLQLKSDLNNFVTKEFDGVCVTYQQVAGSVGREMLRSFIGHQQKSVWGKVFVIFDEPHHMADGLEWGKSAEYAFEYSVGGVLGTGTPFRSDNYRIPFVDYDPQTHELQADYEYLYEHGLVDQVVRALFFRRWDTRASWFSYTEEMKTDVTFYDELDPRQVQERLNAVIHHDSDFVREILEQAYQELLQIRRNDQPNAKGLVICKDINHANAIAKVFERVNGVKPLIVSSDNEHGNKHDIEDFRRNNAAFIISVDMISEGVDIPPLRSLVYLTNVTAPLYFYQAVGRVVRVERGYELANGYVYLPSDPRLMELAQTIKDRRNHVAPFIDRPAPDEDSWMEKTPRPGTVRQTRMFEIVSALAVDDGGIYDAQGYSPDELRQANEWLKVNGFRIPIEEAVKILRVMNASKAEEKVIHVHSDLEERQNNLRKACNSLVYRLSKMLGYDKPTPIHTEWMWKHGGSKQENATIEELERKIAWLKRRINEVA